MDVFWTQAVQESLFPSPCSGILRAFQVNAEGVDVLNSIRAAEQKPVAFKRELPGFFRTKI